MGKLFFSIKNRFLLIICLFLIIPNLIFLYYLVNTQRHNILAELISEKENMLEESSQSLDMQLQEFKDVSMSIYYNPLTRSYIDQEKPLNYLYVQNFLSSIVNSEKYVVSAMLELDGKQIWAGWNYRNAENFLKRYRDQIICQKGRPVWIPTEQLSASISDNLNHFALARAVNAPDHTVGILIIFISEDLIRYVMNRNVLADNSYYYILNENAHVISSNQVDCISHTLNTREAHYALEQSSPYFICGKGPRNETVSVCKRSSETGWSVLLVTDSSVIYGALKPLKKTSFLIFFFDMLFILLAWLILSQNIFKKLDQLSRCMQEVSKGNLSIIESKDEKGEIAQLFEHYNYMITRIGALMENVRLEEKARHEEELKVFSMQIGPHFVYNTLNTIKWMAVANNQTPIKQMVEALIRIMMSTVYGNQTEIPIKEEVTLLKHYVFIQKMRFVNFDIDIILPSELENYRICKLLLQPILENSILHGFKGMERPGKLQVVFSRTKKLLVKVIDNGKGFNADTFHFSKNFSQDQIGIKNVQERIMLLYGRNYGLSIVSHIGVGTTVSLELPLLSSESCHEPVV